MRPLGPWRWTLSLVTDALEPPFQCQRFAFNNNSLLLTTEKSCMHMCNGWPVTVNYTLTAVAGGLFLKQVGFPLAQRSVMWPLTCWTFKGIFVLVFISFGLDVFLDFLWLFSEGKFWPPCKQGTSQEIVFFVAFKYWLDFVSGNVIKLTVVINSFFTVNLLSLYVTCNCLPLFLRVKWRGAIWLHWLYLGRACRESDVLFLLEGRMCLLLRLTSHFSLQMSMWFLCHSIGSSWYINLNDSPQMCNY